MSKENKPEGVPVTMYDCTNALFMFVPTSSIKDVFPDAIHTDQDSISQKSGPGVYYADAENMDGMSQVGIIGECPYLVVDLTDPEKGYCTAKSDKKCPMGRFRFEVTKN